MYGEWHYWGFINNEPDMSEPMLQYFHGWLKINIVPTNYYNRPGVISLKFFKCFFAVIGGKINYES